MLRPENSTEILINLTMLANRVKGMSRYTQEILRRCEEVEDFQKLPITYLFARGNYPQWNRVNGRKCQYVPNLFSVDRGKLLGLARYFIPPILGRRPRFIFNPFYQSCVFLRNQIITIHDLIPLRFPRHNPVQFMAFKWIMPVLLKQAVQVVAVSQATKKSIVDFYGIDEGKITVIPNAVDRKAFPAAQGTRRGDYLLVVGAHLPHKNIHELLRHHDLWRGRYRLEIIAYESSYQRQLKELCRALGITSEVRFLSGIDDRTLLEKYQQARALVFPSLDEGFGIPLLEAMSTGTPVLASDLPVHREVCGDAAIYLTPGRRETWERAFAILAEDSLVQEYVSRGLTQPDKFSWTDSAVGLTALLKKVYHQISLA